LTSVNAVRNGFPEIPLHYKFTSCANPDPQGPLEKSSQPECDMNGVVSGFPENIFRNSVYNSFCAEVSKDTRKSVDWIVDKEGTRVNSGQKRSLRISGRTPPPSAVGPNAYKDYTIQLKWTPKEGAGRCPESCTDALMGIANSGCKFPATRPRADGNTFVTDSIPGGHIGGQSNIMVDRSKHDIGCGTYEVVINIPGSHPTVWPRKCYETDEFGRHEDVHEKDVERVAGVFCDVIDHQATMGPGDKPITKVAYSSGGGGTPFDWPNGGVGNVQSNLLFEVGWDNDCPNPAPGEKTNIRDPTGGAQLCKDLLFNNYKRCKSLPICLERVVA
jgi:hypothetical protein